MSERERIADILGELHERERDGRPVDLDALVQEHPDLADELRSHVEALDLIDGALEDSATPEYVGTYRIERELGRGGMGTVYLARGPDEQEVALKLVHPHLLDKSGFFKRFLREAQLGRKVKHENVVRTLDVDATHAGGRTLHYLVLEHVQGKTLRALGRELGLVPEALLREIALQAAAGLRAIHAAGIVHRDVKPENLLITDDHRVRIMDLGVARPVEATLALTQEGQFAGSLHYAAPEQFEGNDIGPAADLYALGVLLYELATGENPFRADEVATVLRAHLEHVPQRINERVPEVSRFFSELVATLLAKKPGDRIASATVLLELLERGEETEWWSEREQVAARTRRQLPVVPVRRETKLYGREEDLALVRDAWARVLDSQGNTILLEGEAGIGKSRLVDACLQELKGIEAQVLYGSYPPAGGLGAISDALLGRLGAQDLEERLRPYLEAAPTLAPGLAALLKHETPPPGSQTLQGDALHAACVHVMRALAAERPLVWVVEDLHFAGRDGRGLALSLARAVEGHAVLLVLTTRPGGVTEEELVHFGRLETLRRARLARLGARDVVLLLKDAFRSERLAEKLGGRIALKSDGVPLFVFEMIRGLKEGQFVEELPDGSWVESKVIDEIEVPSAVRDLIEVRLGGLTDEERALVDVGATEGFEFDPDLVARVLEAKRVRVLQLLAAVERRSGIVRATGRRYRFDHHQIQEVVYGALALPLREEYHSLLAQTHAVRVEDAASGEDRVFLASHYLRGSRPSDCSPYLRSSLAYLARSFRSEEAVELTGRALEAPGFLLGVERARVLLQKATRHHLRGEPVQEHAALSEARALAEEDGDPALQADVLGALGSLAMIRGELSLARELTVQALALARDAHDRTMELRTRRGLGQVLQHQGRLEEAAAMVEQSTALAKELGDVDAEAAGTINMGVLHAVQDRHREATVCFEKGLEHARRCGNRKWELTALNDLGLSHREHGQYERALAFVEESLALAREIGDRPGEASGLMSLANISSLVGRAERSRALLEKSRAISREVGNRLLEARTAACLGWRYFMESQFDQARDLLPEAIALTQEVGDATGESLATGALGLLAQAEGRLMEALELMEAARARAEVVNDLTRQAELTGYIGRVHLTLGSLERASACFERYGVMAREIGNPIMESIELLHRASYEETTGRPARARELLLEALTARRKGGASGELGSLLCAISRVELKLGLLRAAARHLDEAEEQAQRDDEKSALLACTVYRAHLPGGNAAEATEAWTRLKAFASHELRLEVHIRLWQLTGEDEHLVAAKRLLDFAVEHAPQDCRTTMVEHVRLHRQIMEAWSEYREADEAGAS